jgi:hypothetical protein
MLTDDAQDHLERNWYEALRSVSSSSESTAFRPQLLLQGADKLIEVHVVDIRHRPVGHACVRPVSHVKSAYGARLLRPEGLRRPRPYEHIDGVLSPGVHQRGDRMTRHVVQPSPSEREPGLREVGDRWREIQLPKRKFASRVLDTDEQFSHESSLGGA